MENLKESLTFNQRITPAEAIAQLGQLTGLDDEGVKQKFPDLRSYEGEMLFRDLTDRTDAGHDFDIYFSKGRGMPADFWLEVKMEDGDITVDDSSKDFMDIFLQSSGDE